MGVEEQVRRGSLVCPVTRAPLTLRDGELVTADGTRRFRVVDGVPVLLPDAGTGEYLAEEGGAMASEYGQERGLVALRRRLDGWVNRRDTRPPELREALRQVVWEQGPGAIVLSIGGGPDRWGDHITNLNIDRFANVDVVADAYALPYAHGSHAYPNHFQNLTVVGQNRMLERAGFVIRASGAQGATFALIDLCSVYMRSFLPGRVLPGAIARLLRLLAVVTAPLDRRLAEHPNGHLVASNVFTLAQRP